MIYFDNAATSFPKPPEVLRAVWGTMARLGANPGRSGHRLSLAAGRIVLQCREQLATLLHVSDPLSIVFCFNCTDALNQAIRGCLCRGDHVIVTALEHNSVLRVVNGYAQRGLVEMTLLPPGPDGYVTPRQVCQALRPNTRLVVCNHASNVTGAVQPVAEIGACLQHHATLFLVDAAQSIGLLPVHPEAIHADMVAFPGHKGLLGPYGTGGLYIRPGLSLRPLREGGTGSSSESMLQPEEMPERYESGTLNLAGIAGLLVGVRFVIRHQDEMIQHERALAQRLTQGLKNLSDVTVYGPAFPEVGVVSFNVAHQPSGVAADLLDQSNFAVRGGLHCAPAIHRALGTLATGAVRASVGIYNTQQEVELFLQAVQQIALGRSSS